MMISRNNSIAEKRDLHVGGLGSNASAGLAMAKPFTDAVNASDVWLDKARGVAKDANDYVRDNPWVAVGVVALVGLAAGYLLSRRS